MPARSIAAAGSGTVFSDEACSYVVTVEPPADEPPLFLPRALGVPMPASSLAYQLYTATSGEGRGRDDYSSVAGFYERAAGVHVRKKTQ